MKTMMCLVMAITTGCHAAYGMGFTDPRTISSLDLGVSAVDALQASKKYEHYDIEDTLEIEVGGKQLVLLKEYGIDAQGYKDVHYCIKLDHTVREDDYVLDRYTWLSCDQYEVELVLYRVRYIDSEGKVLFITYETNCQRLCSYKHYDKKGEVMRFGVRCPISCYQYDDKFVQSIQYTSDLTTTDDEVYFNCIKGRLFRGKGRLAHLADPGHDKIKNFLGEVHWHDKCFAAYHIVFENRISHAVLFETYELHEVRSCSISQQLFGEKTRSRVARPLPAFKTS